MPRRPCTGAQGPEHAVDVEHPAVGQEQPVPDGTARQVRSDLHHRPDVEPLERDTLLTRVNAQRIQILRAGRHE